MSIKDMEITFWGVRGSCPSFEYRMQEFGGNTSCVQIQIGDKLLIFDGGTGINSLGKSLVEEGKELKGDIFITHTHWDHIQGLPFFLPFFQKDAQFNIHGQKKKNLSFSNIIKDIMKFPYSPISWDDMKGNLTFKEVKTNEKIDMGDDIYINTVSTDHPGGCLAYKVEYKGKSCSYITDLEHTEKVDMQIKEFIQDTDVLIYDSNFTNEEYYGENGLLSKKGWGHSTWEKGLDTALKANVGKLVLFHHNSNRNDKELRDIEIKAKSTYKNTVVAREKMKIII